MRTRAEQPSSISQLMERALAGDLSMKPIADYSNRGVKLPIDMSMPWARDGVPTSMGCDISMVRVKPIYASKETEENKLGVIVPGHDQDLNITHEGLRLIGHHTGFKVDFIDKLPLELQAEVVNCMLKQHRTQIIQLSGSGNTINQISPGWRHLCAHSEIAQVAYNTIKGISGAVEIHEYSSNDGFMRMKLSTERRSKITAKQGDVLAHGVKIVHRPGVDILVSTYTRRLACENGMETESENFPWTNQKAGTIDHQLDFLVKAINATTSGFDQMVKKAKEMSQIKVVGDPIEALMTRAKHMKIPAKFTQHLVDAYNAEPGDTEWHMLNALTRFATHSTATGIDNSFREAVQCSAGSWTAKFDMVNARLPRSIAVFAGAEILN